MSHARYIVGDVLDVLATLPDASVDLVMTSPPFLALRSYLPGDHPDKQKEIGSEPTPGAFLDALLDIVIEIRRVLAPHGSLVFELGDTFSHSAERHAAPGGTAWGADTSERDWNKGQAWNPGVAPSLNGGKGWPLDKSLCLIPQSFAWSLSYGRNPFTGREIEPWRVRNIVAWCRPNPPVGALGDKFRPATSYLTVACMSRDRYFDLDAVRQPGNSFERDNETKGRIRAAEECPEDGSGWMDGKPLTHHPAGAPPLDYWVIPTHAYPGSHYATFPPALVVKPVEAMCPRRVCRVCGEPSRRITSSDRRGYDPERPEPYSAAMQEQGQRKGFGTRTTGCETVVTTLGWSDCGHDNYRPGVVLDPFAGSGTTLQVATGHGRDAIGIDLDERNAELAYERIGGLFLSIEDAQSAEESAACVPTSETGV